MATVLDINAYGQTDIVEEKPQADLKFLAWLRNEEQRARDEALDEQRKIAIDFYNGEPFGDEEDGRSQIVTRDVAEVIDYMVPSVLRTMASGDRVVEFEALDSGFKDVLEEATEAVSQQFMQEQRGWQILHDSLKSGLLEKTGQIKSYVEVEKVRREREMPLAEFQDFSKQDDIEIIGREFRHGDDDPEAVELMVDQFIADGGMPEETGVSVNVAYIESRPKFVDAPLANEEFGCAKDARDLATSAYYHHRTPKTLSALAELGFDTDEIGWDDGAVATTQLERARDGDARTEDVYRDGPMRQVWYLEEYCRYDLNGDGIAEFLRVHRVGNTILRHKDSGELAIEEIEYGAVEEWCPFPMQHRRVGHSLADKVLDIQRVRSVLMRQALDNLYQSNAPRVLVNEGSIGTSTIDDLLTVRPAGIVRWKGAIAPTPLAVPFVAGNAFEAIEVLNGERESRTGITRLNQGLDADALNKTATGTALMQAQGQQIEEFIARNFAEFIGRVFQKKYRLMKDYGRPFSVIIDGQPKTVDPSQWPDEMRVMVRVGLGSGRKDQRVQHRLTVLEIQKEAMMAGLPNVGPEQIFNSIKGLVADLALGQGTDYFMDPAKMGPQPEKPDPKMVEVQGKQQEAAAKLQLEQAKSAAQLQQSQAESAAKIELMRAEAEAKLQLEREKAALEAELAREKLATERQLAMEKMAAEQQLAEKQADRQHEVAMKQADAKISSNRPGGSLAE